MLPDKQPGGLPAVRGHGMRRAKYNAAGVTAPAVTTTTAGACRQAAAFPASLPLLTLYPRRRTKQQLAFPFPDPAERARPAAADEVVDSWTPPWAGVELIRGRRGRWSPWWGSWSPRRRSFPRQRLGA